MAWTGCLKHGHRLPSVSIGKTLWTPFCCRRSSHPQRPAKEGIRAESLWAAGSCAFCGDWPHPSWRHPRGQAGEVRRSRQRRNTRASPHEAAGWRLRVPRPLTEEAPGAHRCEVVLAWLALSHQPWSLILVSSQEGGNSPFEELTGLSNQIEHWLGSQLPEAKCWPE